MADDTVIRLAADNGKPCKRSCTACRHFHPNTRDFGWSRTFKSWWSWKPPFYHIALASKTPSSNAIHFAQCSFAGGNYASHYRHHCDGDDWEPK